MVKHLAYIFSSGGLLLLLSEGLCSIVSYTNMTAVSQISENNEKSFNMKRICVQKNFLQIIMVAYKPLEWP